MYAILSRSDNAGKVLAKLGTATEVEQQMSEWYDSAAEDLNEEAAADMLENLIVVRLH